MDQRLRAGTDDARAGYRVATQGVSQRPTSEPSRFSFTIFSVLGACRSLVEVQASRITSAADAESGGITFEGTLFRNGLPVARCSGYLSLEIAVVEQLIGLDDLDVTTCYHESAHLLAHHGSHGVELSPGPLRRLLSIPGQTTPDGYFA